MSALLVLAALLLLTGCSGLFFHPERGRRDLSYLGGLKSTPLEVESGDGTRLSGLLVGPEGDTRGTVVFFHGNAENVSTHLRSVAWLAQAGYRLWAVDYRGYGLSEGEATLEGVNADASAILAAALADPSSAGRPVYVLGQSLGGALAIYAVANSPDRGRVTLLIADSAFSSYRRVFREKVAATVIGWPISWPLGFTVDDEYGPEGQLPKLAGTELLFIHATKDPVVGYDHSERLYALAPEPKGFWTVRGVGHTAAFELPEVRSNLLRVMEEVRK